MHLYVDIGDASSSLEGRHVVFISARNKCRDADVELYNKL